MTMRCRATSSTLTSHTCVCVGRRGHAGVGTEDAWHRCGECGTVWTDEVETEFGGDAKVIQLRRVPTSVAYAPGAVQLELGSDPCPICGSSEGVRLQVEFGEYVHTTCKAGWMFAAEAARNHVNTILTTIGANPTLLPAEKVNTAYRFTARTFVNFARSSG